MTETGCVGGRINPNKGTVEGQWPPPCESLLREAPKAPKPQGQYIALPSAVTKQ